PWMDSSMSPALRCAKLWSLLASNTMKSSLFSFLILTAALLVLKPFTGSAETFTEGVRVSPDTLKLKTGEYVWEPERAPEGPLLIVASTTEQVAYVYRNGVRIARSSVSTGRPGHPTPTGVFTILEKEVHHTSSIYKGAEMPYMERVTWGGIALHAGDLPGYPDSHGCIRLPLEFSKLLFGVTMKGATVIIADVRSAPAETVHPGLFFTQSGEERSSESLFAAAQKSRLPTGLLAKAKEVITPGTTIIFTDKPVDPTTQSATGFQILVAQKDKPSAKTD